MSLNLNIRPLRQARGLTLAQLADKVGISVAHMSEVERGLKNLNNHLIMRISSALDVKPDTLIASDIPDDLRRLSAVLERLDARDRARVAAFAEALLSSAGETEHGQ